MRVVPYLLAGNGKGLCGGYDLVRSAEDRTAADSDAEPPGSALDGARGVPFATGS